MTRPRRDPGPFANEHDRQESLRVAEKNRQRRQIPFMTLPSGEKYSLQGKCLMCSKKIWMGNRCYTCSVGSPRFILRPDERPISVN